MPSVDLQSPFTLKNAFLFPIQNERARGEVLWGAVLLILLPGVGWLLNMGHRIRLVHYMHRGNSPWPAWNEYMDLLKHGLITFGGMVYYYLPGKILAGLSLYIQSYAVGLLAVVLLLLATLAIPGFMTHYCVHYDPSEIYNPIRAMKRVWEGGADYWKAWGIALLALLLSFTGLLFFGVGFLVTSVWFWQVAGFSFATVFSQKFQLAAEE
jgi:hypothetical protein